MKRFLVAVALLLVFGTCTFAEPGGSAVVLDTTSFWRVHYTFRPPVVREGKDLHTLPTLAGETPAPPGGWVSTGFDDSLWRRTPGDLFPLRNIGWRMDRTLLAESGITGSNGSSPALAMIALRGKFGVTNPAAVKGLKVSLAYQGGVVVTVNGREVGRANFAGNDPGPEALAEDYPTSAFLKANGSPVMDQAGVTRQKDPQVVSAFKSRTRRTKIPIPSRALRKGTNVLAVAIHRAAYVPGVSKWMEAKGIPQHQRYSFLWATCGMVSMNFESPSPRGLRLNVARPAGIQVWNSRVMQQDFDLDYGDPFEPLRPIRLVGSRDGVFSGKVVVGSDQPIKGLEARISNLVRKGGDGKIASSAVKVRYALPTGSEPYTASHYPAPADLLDGLSDAAPAVVALRPKPRGQWPFGAVCPVWVTAAVPRDAVPGDYTGTLTLTARGLPKPVEVPVTMKVCAWRVPKPSEFRTIVDLIQSPESVAMHYGVPIYSNRHFQLLRNPVDVPRNAKAGTYTGKVTVSATGEKNVETPIELRVVSDWVVPDPNRFTTYMGILESPDSVAMQYKVPLWSEEHWKLLDRTFELLGQLGNREVYIPLIARTMLGNEQSMVRWVKQPDGSFKHDFTVAERYLDLAVKHHWNVSVTCLAVSDGTIGSAIWYSGKPRNPPGVTVFDPATGQLSEMDAPAWGTPEARKFWKPVVEGMQKIFRKRGLEKSMMFGFVVQGKVLVETIGDLKPIAPNVKWWEYTHWSKKRKGNAKTWQDVGRMSWAYGTPLAVFWEPGVDKPFYAWKNLAKDVYFVAAPRAKAQIMVGETGELSVFRLTCETTLLGSHGGHELIPAFGAFCGFGQVGADFWPVKTGPRSRKAQRLDTRYVGWGSLSLNQTMQALLGAGKSAPAHSCRTQMLRESQQEAEARVFVQNALLDKKSKARLGPKLARRCEQICDDRTRMFFFCTVYFGERGQEYGRVFNQEQWDAQTELLYKAAADVAKVLSVPGRRH